MDVVTVAVPAGEDVDDDPAGRGGSLEFGAKLRQLRRGWCRHDLTSYRGPLTGPAAWRAGQVRLPGKRGQATEPGAPGLGRDEGAPRSGRSP